MSEPDGLTGDPVAVNGQFAQYAEPEPESAREAESERDPWFEPAARPVGEAGTWNGGWTDHSNGLADAPDADGSHQTDWFLRTGRAGLQPESMTESWNEEAGHAHVRPETAAKPPWAGEQAAAGSDSPPPWESGPWPGPGEAADELPERAQPLPVQARPLADASNWQATAALATGILPVVVPGLVLGVLGLRRASVTGTGRTWSWLGIGLSLIWAIILIAFLAGGGGSSTQACGSYQNDVNYPVAQVLRDLAAGAPRSVLVQDLHHAIGETNSAAAAAQQVTDRNAMVTLTTGLQQALTAVTAAHSPVSDAALHNQIELDARAVDRSCSA